MSSNVAGPSRTCFTAFGFTFLTTLGGCSSSISASSISASRMSSSSISSSSSSLSSGSEGVIVSSSSIERTISGSIAFFFGFEGELDFALDGKPTSLFESPASSRRSTKFDFFPEVGRSLRIHNALSLATVKEDVCSPDITKPHVGLSPYPFKYDPHCISENPNLRYCDGVRLGIIRCIGAI